MPASSSILGKPLQDIETPALLVRRHVLEANIRRLQAAADAAEVQVRPHIKAHKTPEIALMQVRAGAVGVTAATLREAQVMAGAGIEDIFLANEVVGEAKTARLAALARRVPRLSTLVDSLPCAEGLSEAFGRAGLTLEVLLEVDAGAGRCGVPPDDLPALAAQVAGLPGLRMAGVMAYAALAYQARGAEEQAEAAAAEGAFLAAQARRLTEAGFRVARISGGCTPTGLHYRKGCGLTEIRSGTYCLYDHNQVDLGTAGEADVAATILGQVISVPARNRAIVDAGTKALDQQVSPLTEGYGWTRGHPRLKVYKINDEHGYVDITGTEAPVGVGDKLEIIPPRICTALNLYDVVYVVGEDDRVEDVWEIRARGH